MNLLRDSLPSPVMSPRNQGHQDGQDGDLEGHEHAVGQKFEHAPVRLGLGHAQVDDGDDGAEEGQPPGVEEPAILFDGDGRAVADVDLDGFLGEMLIHDRPCRGRVKKRKTGAFAPVSCYLVPNHLA